MTPHILYYAGPHNRVLTVSTQVLIFNLVAVVMGWLVDRQKTEHNENCIIEVKDEGPGIRPEHLPKIFTPFFTTKKNGQGLALAGCRKTLRDMGGDIQVDSRLGDGATFTLIIPRDYSGKPLINDPVASVLQGRGPGRLYRE